MQGCAACDLGSAGYMQQHQGAENFGRMPCRSVLHGVQVLASGIGSGVQRCDIRGVVFRDSSLAQVLLYPSRNAGICNTGFVCKVELVWHAPKPSAVYMHLLVRHSFVGADL